MARARLHLICSNCGCNDEWVYRHIEEETQAQEVVQDEDIFLTCKNCGTVHSLNDNAKQDA